MQADISSPHQTSWELVPFIWVCLGGYLMDEDFGLLLYCPMKTRSE